MQSSFIPKLLDGTISVVGDAHGVVVDPDGARGRPQLRLHFRRQVVLVPLPGDDEGAVVVERRVGAAPNHERPVRVRNGHPAPVLDLK